jgi:ribosomal protein L11 methyltransferase
MAEASWVEVSLIVDGELAEATAEVLARFAPDGVVIESTAITAEADDSEGRAVGPLRVFGYLPADERLEETRQRLQEALWYLGRIRPLPEAQFRPIQHTNWAETWKEHYRPIPIGRRLMIVPAWLEVETQDRIPIRIDPGMAFGTGTHPTTQLCLELIEEILQPDYVREQDRDVIDVGCGTAILSIAALKLGARRALGVDIDPDAIQAARENAQTNGVAERLELGQGSLAEIRAGQFSLRQSPLVLANILAPVLRRLLDEGLEAILSPGGYLVLSGILEEQAEEVLAAAQRHPLSLAEQRQSGDWVALCLQKS